MKEFMDAYKHLEKLYSEIYGGQYGITQYITDMEQTSSYDSRGISGWDEDLKTLKRLRYIRNKMVHDTADYDLNYEQEDIKFLKDFYQRIMNQQDPISICRKRKQDVVRKAPHKSANPTQREHTAIYIPKYVDITPPKKKENSTALKIGIAILVFVIVVLAVILTTC